MDGERHSILCLETVWFSDILIRYFTGNILTRDVSLISATTSNDEADNNLKLINGYMLWLSQYYNGRDITLETIPKGLLRPLRILINKVNFDDMVNVWCDSRLLFGLIKQEHLASNICIRKAITDFQPKIGEIVFKSSSIKFFSDVKNRNENSLESESTLCSELDDYPGLSQNIVKIVHFQYCRVAKRVGFSSQEMDTYSCILGIDHNHTPVNEEGKLVHGWIINPQWKNACSDSNLNN